MTDWTPAMQAWLDETMSRRKEPTIAQLDTVRTAFATARRATRTKKAAS